MKKIFESVAEKIRRKRAVSGGTNQVLAALGTPSFMANGGSDDGSDDKSGGEPIRGPWGGGTNGENRGEPNRSGPRNPWTQPPPGDRPSRGGGQRPTAIDELWRMGRDGIGRRGGGGDGGAPGFGPGGRSIWPLVAIAFVALWLVFTSFHRIDSSEEGVVTRFGKFSRNVGPGINMTLPSPFEKLEKVNVALVRTLEIGSADPNAENLVLTGDKNIVDLAYAVRWKIKNPQQYLFQMAEPEDTIKEVAESAMRATVANFDLTEAIGPARGAIEGEVRERMQTLLDSYKAGILIEGVALNQTAPPEAVKDAFNEVSAAQQKSEGYQNDARAYAQQVTQGASGEAAAFDKVYEQYKLAPEVTRRRMYYETMENVLSQVDKAVVQSNNTQTYLPLPELRKRAEPAPPVEAAPAPAKEGQ